MSQVIIKCNNEQIKTSWYNIKNIPLFEKYVYEENMIIDCSNCNINILNKLIDLYRFNNVHINIEEKFNKLYNQLYIMDKFLDVGGEVIRLTEKDISVSKLLSCMFNETYNTTHLFLDMNPKKFKHILSYLKEEVDDLDSECIMEYDYMMSVNEKTKTKTNIIINSNEYDDNCNVNYPIEQHFTRQPQITFTQTIIRKFTKVKSKSTYIENNKINDNEYKFIIPIDIYAINYYILIINISKLNNLIKANNLIIEQHDNFLNFIDKIDVAYGDMHICTITGDTMIYHNEKLPKQEFLVNDQIIIPFHYYMYIYKMMTHYNICENKLLNFTIKFNDIRNYIIVKPYNNLLIKHIEFDNYIQNIKCLVKHQQLSNLELNRIYNTSIRDLQIHKYQQLTQNIDQNNIIFNIDNNCYVNKIILFISNNNKYKLNNLIKQVSLIGYINIDDNVMQTIYDDSYHMISTYYNINNMVNMSDIYLIITFSPYCNMCNNLQITPGIDLSKYHDVRLNIQFNDKAINNNINVLIKEYKTLYYKHNYIESYIE